MDYRAKFRMSYASGRNSGAVLALERTLDIGGDAIPGVASILLLVAHEALETERDIQGAVEEEEVGGVVAKEAVEVVGMKPGEELLDRRVVAFFQLAA